MAVNKIEAKGKTLIDLTADTVTPETLCKGIIAHNAKGEAIIGTLEVPNIKVYKVTLSADHTNMWHTLVSNDPFLASLYNDPNAFILMYGKNTAKASTSMKDVWFYLGTTVAYAGATARNNLLVRQSTSAITVMPATGISADNYNGNFKLDSTGTLKTYGKTDYTMVAGEYCIIAGSV